MRPILRNGRRKIEVQTLEEQKEEFESVYSVGNMLRRDRRGRILGASISVVLASIATMELSKTILPLVSTGIPPINRWHPLLEQIGTYSETSLAVGILTAFGAFYIGKSALYDRFRYKGIRRAYNQIECSSADYPSIPPESPGESP